MKIKHASVGATLSQTQWEAEDTHLINGVENLSIVRTATKVVSASDASAEARAMSDSLCDGTNDEEEIQAATDA